ncbi:MAG: APC family permease [Myxococcales bacterium]|nr:APC family permease [Myxococcales bacterium]
MSAPDPAATGPGAAPGSADGLARPPRALGSATAILLIIASMVGTGVFTTTGFLIRDLGSTSAVLLAWALGGLTAVCGALAYAELAAALPHNGGEYTLLSRIYHPAVGFIAGWISLVVGFSAPMAASAIAFGDYLGRILPGVDPSAAGLAAILVLALLHGLRVRLGGIVQNLVTAATVVLIVLFIAGGLAVGDLSRITPLADPSTAAAVASPAFAVGLVFVSFAYSGWNAAAYVAGEIDRPGKSIPRSLILGTLTVAALYLGLNLVFVIAAPAADLAGVVEVGYVAAEHLFGDPLITAGLTVIVALGLLTTVSALMMAGPRVYEALGADYPRFRRLAGRLTGDPGDRGPAAAIALQVVIAAAMVLTASFDQLLTYMGMTLALSSGLTVAGVFVLRRREPGLPRPYRTWGHPLTTLIALALMAWMIAFTVAVRPLTSLVAAATIAAGLVVYALVRPRPGPA